MGFPWDKWVPGVLNSLQMKQLLDDGFITTTGSRPEVGHSSMDLTLADEAYEMLKGSVKPSQKSYKWFIENKGLAKKIEKTTEGCYELERKHTYVFRLQERLEAALRNGGVIYGQATAKSSVGRVDVLARLIVDGMNTYERFEPTGLKDGSGDMYPEITPITFDVKVKANKSLSQLRFFYGRPDDVEIRAVELFHTVFGDSKHEDGNLTVSLSDATVGDIKGVTCKGVAFRSKTSKPDRSHIPLWNCDQEDDKPNPVDYWDIVVADENKRLLIENDVFYILRSKEKLYVPKGIAIYCRASDETMGEMRIHYAGFVHPYFGLYREDTKQGTPLIFEVRGHQVRVSLGDGEKMASLIFYRMSEDAPDLTPEEEKKEAEGYGSQDLKLSTRFRNWPRHIKRNNDGTVEEVKRGEEDDKVKAI